MSLIVCIALLLNYPQSKSAQVSQTVTVIVLNSTKFMDSMTVSKAKPKIDTTFNFKTITSK